MWFNSLRSLILGLFFTYQIVFVCSGLFNKKIKDFSTMVIQNVNAGKGKCGWGYGGGSNSVIVKGGKKNKKYGAQDIIMTAGSQGWGNIYFKKKKKKKKKKMKVHHIPIYIPIHVNKHKGWGWGKGGGGGYGSSYGGFGGNYGYGKNTYSDWRK